MKRSSGQNNKLVIIKALQCLMEYVRIYYNYLEEILKTMWENISPYLSLDDQELAISALEVFNVIAREDKDRANKVSFQGKKLNVRDLVVQPLPKQL